MSEHEAQDSPQPSQDDQSGAEPGSEEAYSTVGPEDEAPPESRVRRPRSGAVAWLALLLAVGAAGLASQPYWTKWIGPGGQRAAETAAPTMEEFRALSERLQSIDRENEQAMDTLRRGLEDLEAELEAMAAQSRDLPGRIDRLAERLARLEGDHNTRLGGIRSRIDDLEEEVGRRLERFELRLADVGTDLDRADHDLATRLRLVEVDSLFALAQDQLAVSGNVETARAAWQRGLERLTALDGAEFGALKETARREFQRLQAFQPPDTAADIERIHAIIGEIEQWPARSVRAQGPQDSESSSPGWRDRLGSVLDGLVTIESVDGEYLSPAEVDLAREQLRTTLQAAALALIRANDDMARSLIRQALAGAERGFETDAAVVSDSLEWLADLVARDASDIRPPSLDDSRAEIARLLGSAR